MNVFDTGALAPGVTVDRVDYRILSFDAGMKYKGIFLQTEIYNRWLDNFKADGAAAGGEHPRHGLLRAGRRSSRCRRSSSSTARRRRSSATRARASATAPSTWSGTNYYPFDTRNHRLNVQLIDVNRSPVSSAFGYYVGGQTGTTFSTAFSVFF